MTRTYTSFYWVGAEVFRTVFEAETDGTALREHEELGPCAYDDRRLLAGDVAQEDLRQGEGVRFE